MAKYINKSALIAEIEKLKSNLIYGACASQIAMETRCKEEAYNDVLSFINTLEVKEMPETAHTECKKIKKLCEIQRYDENGKVYSVMLPDTRLFMNKINDVIDAIDNIESRLQTVEQKI